MERSPAVGFLFATLLSGAGTECFARLPTMYLTHLDYLDMRHNALTGAVPGFCNNKLLIRGGDCQLREQSTGPFKCNTTGYPWCLSEPYSACYAECVP